MEFNLEQIEMLKKTLPMNTLEFVCMTLISLACLIYIVKGLMGIVSLVHKPVTVPLIMANRRQIKSYIKRIQEKDEQLLLLQEENSKLKRLL